MIGIDFLTGSDTQEVLDLVIEQNADVSAQAITLTEALCQVLGPQRSQDDAANLVANAIRSYPGWGLPLEAIR